MKKIHSERHVNKNGIIPRIYKQNINELIDRVERLENNMDNNINKELNEKYLSQMKLLKCEADHDEADCILCYLLKDLGYDELVEVYRKLPKWYS